MICYTPVFSVLLLCVEVFSNLSWRGSFHCSQNNCWAINSATGLIVHQVPCVWLYIPHQDPLCTGPNSSVVPDLAHCSEHRSISGSCNEYEDFTLFMMRANVQVPCGPLYFLMSVTNVPIWHEGYMVRKDWYWNLDYVVGISKVNIEINWITWFPTFQNSNFLKNFWTDYLSLSIEDRSHYKAHI